MSGNGYSGRFRQILGSMYAKIGAGLAATAALGANAETIWKFVEQRLGGAAVGELEVNRCRAKEIEVSLVNRGTKPDQLLSLRIGVTITGGPVRDIDATVSPATAIEGVAGVVPAEASGGGWKKVFRPPEDSEPFYPDVIDNLATAEERKSLNCRFVAEARLASQSKNAPSLKDDCECGS